MEQSPGFYEFFAGGGMVRAGLGPKWRCLFANDFDRKKTAVYSENWGAGEIVSGDIRNVKTEAVPGVADLAWASFPCQDLSLAGGGAGLEGGRSGTFWPFWSLMKGLISAGRPPKLVVLENVCGTLSSHGGKDFAAICSALNKEGYRFGAVVIDAALFVPQSRPRLFVIAVRENLETPEGVALGSASGPWFPAVLKGAFGKLPVRLRRDWIWWNLPNPPKRRSSLADLVEERPKDVAWHPAAETRRLLSMMSEVNRAKVGEARRAGRKVVGTIYKRTRRTESGGRVQRAEVRFDGVAGCLRTPAGGSSRQLIVVIDGRRVRSRLMSSRETARLMGLPESYRLPESYNEAYHLTGDGVVVSVVRHLAEHIFEPILSNPRTRKGHAA